MTLFKPGYYFKNVLNLYLTDNKLEICTIFTENILRSYLNSSSLKILESNWNLVTSC